MSTPPDLATSLDHVRAAILRELPQDLAIEAFLGLLGVTAAVRRAHLREIEGRDTEDEARVLEGLMLGNLDR
jgi:hypothetical protein